MRILNFNTVLSPTWICGILFVAVLPTMANNDTDPISEIYWTTRGSVDQVITTEASNVSDSTANPYDLMDTGNNSAAANMSINGSFTITTTEAPCYILAEWGTETFFFKYSFSLVAHLLCVCRNHCLDDITTVSPKERERLANEANWFLSSSNRWKFVMTICLLGPVFLFGFVGNILTITCLTCWIKKKSSTFLFILSLACSDILLLMTALPMKCLEVNRLGDKILNGPLCFLAYYLRDFSLASSVLTLTTISFERFYAICYPLKAQFRCSTRRARVLIVLTWIGAASLSVPTILVTKSSVAIFTGNIICRQMTDDYSWVRAYHLYELTLLYFVPLGIMGYTYARSCLALYRSAQSAKNMQGDRESKTENGITKEKSSATTATTTGETEKEKIGDEKGDKGEGSIKARIKVMQMLVAMLLVFVVCWGPMLFYLVFKSFDIKPKALYEQWVRLGLETMAFANSSINPYFYMGMSSHFRREFRRRFGWIVGKKGPLPGDTSVMTSSTMSTRYQSGVYSTAASGQPRI